MTAPTVDVPPQNIEAEKALAGSLLVTDAAWAAIHKAGLRPDDFYLEKHRVLYAAIAELATRAAPCDEIAVADALDRAGRLDDAGGRHYISELAATVPAASNAGHYAAIVKAHAVDRAKGEIGLELTNGLGPVEAIEKLRKLERRRGDGEADSRLRVLDVGAMVATSPPEIPYVIEGLAIERTLTLISGREGEGKSLLMMALAGGVGLGEDVAGFACAQRRVLVIDAENGEYEIHRRVKTLGLPSEGVTVVEADDFHLGRDLAALEALIEREQPGLVILDSFRSLWPGGEENDSGAVAAVLDPLRNMLRRQGPAGILLHHVSRAGNDYRGTSAIGAAIEMGFRLARHPDDPEARDRRFLRCFKCRPAPEPEDRWLRLHIERGQVFIEETEPFAAEEVEEAPAAPKRAELAPSLLAAAAKPIAWPDLARAIDRSPKDGTARRLRDDLLAAGELVKGMDGLLQVPNGVAPSDSASQSQSEGKVSGARPPIGASEVAPSNTDPCRYPDHRSTDYIGDGGKTICGICHPRTGESS
jgi:hypothetical protein